MDGPHSEQAGAQKYVVNREWLVDVAVIAAERTDRDEISERNEWIRCAQFATALQVQVNV